MFWGDKKMKNAIKITVNQNSRNDWTGGIQTRWRKTGLNGCGISGPQVEIREKKSEGTGKGTGEEKGRLPQNSGWKKKKPESRRSRVFTCDPHGALGWRKGTV